VALIVIVLNAVVSLGGRVGVSIVEREGRDYLRYSSLLYEHIPQEAVVIGHYNIYYAGLQRGWDMYLLDSFTRTEPTHEEVYVVVPLGQNLPQWPSGWNIEFVANIHDGDTSGMSGTRTIYAGYIYHATRHRLGSHSVQEGRTHRSGVGNKRQGLGHHAGSNTEDAAVNKSHARHIDPIS